MTEWARWIVITHDWHESAVDNTSVAQFVPACAVATSADVLKSHRPSIEFYASRAWAEEGARWRMANIAAGSRASRLSPQQSTDHCRCCRICDHDIAFMRM